MHILVTESSFGESARLATSLRQLGCQVSTCHSTVGICRAFAPGDRCPLDGGRPVDLVVDVRDQSAQLTAREYGVVCATRAKLPVVLVNSAPDVPVCVPAGLESRATGATVDTLLSACGQAVALRGAGPDRTGGGRSGAGRHR
ncbi:MAG TPA: hypothetical protein VJX10_20725 [Pseudonocardiaceae bacterium]|nr:hypothetical protein [Pseudonocardiaceae bacterium]